MKLNRTKIELDRTARNNENENWDRIEMQNRNLQNQIDTLVLENGDSSPEVAQARVGIDGHVYTTLKERLDTEQEEVNHKIDNNHQEVKSQLAETAKKSDLVIINQQLAQKPTKEEVEALLAGIADGTPLFAESISEMTDITRLYVNTTDGFIYVYDGNVFKSTGLLYQAAGLNKGAVGSEELADGAVGKSKLNNDLINNKPTTGVDSLTYEERRRRLPITADKFKIISDPSNKTTQQIQSEWGVEASYGEIDGGTGVKITASVGEHRRIRKNFDSPVEIFPYLSFNFIANEHVESLIIELSDRSFENGFRYTITNVKAGYNNLIINKVDFNVQVGEPNFENIEQIRIAVLSKSTGQGEVTFGRIDNYGYDKALITVWFDDGHHTVYNHAKPIMDQYSLVGTHSIVGSWIGTPQRMDRKQLYEMMNEGWEHCNHGWEHKRQSMITVEESEIELQKNLDYGLTHNFGKSAYYYVNPGGVNSEMTDPIQKKYSTLRRRGRGYNLLPIVDMYEIRSLEPLHDTPVEEVYEWIDRSIEGGLWLCLLFHLIRPDEQANQVLTYGETKFDLVMNYLKQKQDEGKLRVVTVSEALNYI